MVRSLVRIRVRGRVRLGVGLGLGLGCEVARLQEHVRGVACAQGKAGPCEGRGRCKGVGDVCSMVIG